MGGPTSEVGYTWDHEVYMDMWCHWKRKKLRVHFAKKVSTFVLKRQSGSNSVTKRLETVKECVACRLGVRHSVGKPERKKGLYVIGVDGGILLRSPYKI
jgi:hypothetical protein